MRLTKRQLEILLDDTYLSSNGKNLYAKCPKCGKNEFGVSLGNNNVFACFRKNKCGFSGNARTLLLFLGREDMLNEKESVSIFEPIKLDFDAKKDVISVPNIEPPFGWRRQYSNEYLESRGVTHYQFKKHKIGTSIFKKGYVTILIEMHNEIKGYITRSYKSKDWHDKYGGKRYDNSLTDFSKLLMGYDEIIEGETKSVILVEGFLDKFSVDSRLDLDHINWLKCCCTFGGKISNYQFDLLRNKKVKELIILFDPDILEITKGLAEEASIYFDVKIGRIPLGKDPNEMNSVELIVAIEEAVSYLNMKLGLV